MAQPSRPLAISRGTIMRRGILLQCPNCGAAAVMRGYFRPAKRCGECGLMFEREDGFYLGAIVLNYIAMCLGGPIPAVALWLTGWLAPGAALTLGIAGAFITPVLFYPLSRSLNLTLYYATLPDHLPANGSADRPG